MNLKKILNHDFRNTAINQLWRLLSGPALLILVPIYLSPEAQGYWYTFISMAALAVFADMGFSAVLLLFASHEFAHLKFNNQKELSGPAENISRLATLLSFAMRWATAMALVVFPAVLAMGYYVLSGKSVALNWQLPWLLYGAASVLVFINSIALSFIEGCDSVGDIQKIRFHISIISVLVSVGLLITGADLYALAFSLLASALVGSMIILRRYKAMLSQLYRLARLYSHPWFKEIMPLMWRFALSWISGYFVLSIFTPLTFSYHGAVQAGQVGLSIAVCMAMFSIANIWITIITPKINIFAAQSNTLQLNSIFKKGISLSILTYIMGMVALFTFTWLMKGHPLVENRLLPTPSLLMVSVGWLLQLAINGMAIYMRAHKKEPLVVVSVANGLYVAITTWLAAKYLPFEYLFSGFVSAYLLVLPWVYWIFRSFKRPSP
ncbi:hypothetical protein RJC98_02580 [Pseudomonas allii]|uniref:Uncharacterized protein n=2 Tax=Pseudomonas allii TaxID=2740531 RepID=A0A7Y8UXD6_9PSED|nr:MULTISPECIES: hypothetical protein [Pseudomonas]KTB65710.1 flippase [Pseudomonas fluorescens]MDR9874056.1 hypothetical protein [Pseudomonas allii]NWN48310.1 hypothetical protein [Pseudomonas allii]NWN61702.1 hypothetical protein [Pseudomonas allii]RMP72123.1 hypothetical protein ALQ17_04667 [Pseudomonas fluorescens]